MERSLIVKQPPKTWRCDPRVKALLDGKTVANFTVHDEIEYSISLRKQQEIAEIFPAISKGVDVLMHRYIYSLFAYYYAEGNVPLESIEARAREFLRPDLIFVVDIPPSCSIRRAQNRSKPIMKHQEDIKFVTSMRDFYLSLEDKIGAIILDGMQPPEQIFVECRSLVQSCGLRLEENDGSQKVN